jgi:type III secretion protein J
VSEIDGVVSARVHVVLPDNDPLQRNAVPASASVFIRHEPSLDINTLIPQIKTLVANGIAGLTYEKVSVIPVAAATMNPTNPNTELTSFLGIWMVPESATKAKWLFGALIAAVLGLGAALAFLVLQSKRRRIYPLVPVEPAK